MVHHHDRCFGCIGYIDGNVFCRLAAVDGSLNCISTALRNRDKRRIECYHRTAILIPYVGSGLVRYDIGIECRGISKANLRVTAEDDVRTWVYGEYYRIRLATATIFRGNLNPIGVIVDQLITHGGVSSTNAN